MIGWLHRLRRDEEGQTLVLAAIFGLILALCVLGTVNLGRAVYDKVQLQTACDDGAYSQAAVEARVLNFTAYTNRAMVAHYASIMASSAYLTWLHFMYVFVKAGLSILKVVPYVGQIAAVIDTVIHALVLVMDGAVALMTPLIAAANVVLYSLQEGAWLSVYSKRLGQIPPEAHSGDSPGNPYQPIWPNLIPKANQAIFAQVRGNPVMGKNTIDSLKMLINASDDTTQAARLHMIEVANSARTAWVAYGDRYQNPTGIPMARHWKLPLLICNAQVGAVARTELGSYRPNGLKGIGKIWGQVFSGSRLQVDARCKFLGIFDIDGVVSLFGLTTLDDAFKFSNNSNYFGAGGNTFWAKLLARALNNVGFLKTGVAWAQKNAPVNADYRAFLISPYVSFAPRAAARPGGGLSALGNFAQPDVIFGLAKEGLDFNREPGAAKIFGHRFQFNGKAAGTGAVDFQYTDPITRIPGAPGNLAILHQGLNTFCAAQVYYHRPGDWREMPNLFNPLWAARLMPVMESNAAASMGLTAVATLKNYLLH